MQRSHQKPVVTNRPAERKARLVRELRGRIVRGELAPGSRLPNRQEIEQEFGLSSDTVQSALSDLREDGFVQSRGRNGTFVSDTPPHLNRYALGFGEFSEPDIQLRFWHSLAGMAGSVAAAFGREIGLYYGLDSHQDSEDFVRLQAEVESHRVAGIIFPTSPHNLVGTPILSEPGIPRVVIASEKLQVAPEIPVVCPDNDALIARAFQEFKSRGRKSLAVIMPWLPQSRHLRFVSGLKRRAAEIGLESQPYWWHFFDHGRSESAASLAHLLFNSRQLDRPDALFIADDNLVEPTTRGIAESGIRIPEELEIITHCNFPFLPESHVPVSHIGFDVEVLLERCVIAIDRQRAGQAVEPIQLVQPRFEWEPAPSFKEPHHEN